MKKRWMIMVAVLMLSVTACGPMYEYRDLDGMWQLRQIVYYTTDESGNRIESEPQQLDNLYFSFQKHIINIRRTDIRSYFGTFDYTDSSMDVIINDATKDEMKKYGMNDTIQHFSVEKADGSKLILKSDYARLEFRDY